MIPIGPKVLVKKFSTFKLFGTVGQKNFSPNRSQKFRLAVGSKAGSNVYTQAVVPYYKIMTF